MPSVRRAVAAGRFGRLRSENSELRRSALCGVRPQKRETIMRKLVWTCIGCLLLATGEARSRETKPAAEDATRRERRSAARKEGALLRFTESVYDFGRVPRRGGDLAHDFVFVNEGTVPLVVTRVFTSCSCLKASYSKRPVAPGGEGVIRITYEPSTRSFRSTPTRRPDVPSSRCRAAPTTKRRSNPVGNARGMSGRHPDTENHTRAHARPGMLSEAAGFGQQKQLNKHSL